MTDQTEIIDAAMALWEAVLDAKGRSLGVTAAFERVGTAALRYTIGGWAETCHREWQQAHEAGEFDEPFDWEWCPAWLDERIDWSDLSVMEAYPVSDWQYEVANGTRSLAMTSGAATRLVDLVYPRNPYRRSPRSPDEKNPPQRTRVPRIHSPND